MEQRFKAEFIALIDNLSIVQRQVEENQLLRIITHNSVNEDHYSILIVLLFASWNPQLLLRLDVLTIGQTCKEIESALQED